jgi:hypothetical protein
VHRVALALALLIVTACTAPDAGAPSTGASPSPTACADVTDAAAEQAPDGTWRFDVTVASADSGWDKYADAWEVRLPDGTVVGTRELTHPHVDEQPFTRSLGGVEVPDGTDSVTVAARDSVSGYCGRTFDVDLVPGR